MPSATAGLLTLLGEAMNDLSSAEAKRKGFLGQVFHMTLAGVS